MSEMPLSDEDVKKILEGVTGEVYHEEDPTCYIPRYPEIHGIFYVKISGLLTASGSARSEVRLKNLMAHDHFGNMLPATPFHIANFPLYHEGDDLKLADKDIGKSGYVRIEHGIITELFYRGTMMATEKDG